MVSILASSTSYIDAGFCSKNKLHKCIEMSGRFGQYENKNSQEYESYMSAINYIDSGNYNLEKTLRFAAEKNKSHIIHYLLFEKKVYVNATDKNDWTALHHAGYNQSCGAIEELLQCEETNANASDCCGWTPAHWAACKETEINYKKGEVNKIFECGKAYWTLFENGKANTKKVNPHGTTPFDLLLLLPEQRKPHERQWTFDKFLGRVKLKSD
jgi:ankyrin repeat protein